MVLGVVFAVIVSILFSLYILPRKFSKQKTTLYMVYLGLALFITIALWYFIAWCFNLRGIREGLDSLLSPWHLLSCLTGILWGIGGVLYNLAIEQCGISRPNQWKNLQGPVGSLLMLFILNEVTGWEKILLVILGMFAIFFSAVCFSVRREGEAAVEKRNLKRGILLAAMSAFFFGTNSFVAQVITRQGFVFSQVFYFALFVFLTSFVVFVIKNAVAARISNAKCVHSEEIQYYAPQTAESNNAIQPNPAPTFKSCMKKLVTPSKQTLLPLLGGFLYAVAAIFSILARSMIPGSISFSIIQLNGLWVALIGIFIFKEIRFRKHWLRICTGLILSVGAIVLLLFAL